MGDNMKSTQALMNGLARGVDDILNGKVKPRKYCFVLLIMPFNEVESRVNYISNGDREEIVTALKEILARFEGQAEVQGRA